jgi:hypothetical protein
MYPAEVCRTDKLIPKSGETEVLKMADDQITLEVFSDYV